MRLKSKNNYLILGLVCLLYASCKLPTPLQGKQAAELPASYTEAKDTVNSGTIGWRAFITDRYLQALIDTALENNLEMKSTLQNIEMARNNVLWRQGLLRPNVKAGGALGIEKVGLYTSQGAGDASADITPGKKVPEWLPDLFLGFQASWEADIWGKLRTAKKAAYAKLLGSVEGRNFVQTNLIAELANSYYELLALDNQLVLIRKSIALQKDVLEIVKVQKEATVANELAVKQFEAHLYSSQGLEFEAQQRIKEVENNINFLLGRFPQKIERDQSGLLQQSPSVIREGIPAQLLSNRPDIRQAELELTSAKLDVRVAQLEFYPSLGLTGLLGYSAFKPRYLFSTPESFAFGLAGDIAGPIINRSAITAEFKNANAYQIQALYEYQKSILKGFTEVSTELSNIQNLEKIYELKAREAATLTRAIDISSELFKAARANYLEVLTAQREALDTQLELVETRKKQFNAMINVYKALGGGWK